MNSIEFKDVCKSYDGRNNVIDHLNVTIPSSERIILLGPSGCGKTTILRMIAGLEGITSGELYLSGKLVNDVEPGDRNIAMVFQNYALYPHMTVEDNILFGMKVAKVSKQEQQKQLNWALDILGLSEYKKRYPKELSGGQRQRVALCRALVKKAPYFLLDEPLSNLDAQLRTNARAELVKIHGVYNPTFVYVTHDQIEAMTVGQRIIVLNNSLIQQFDTPDNIYNRPRNVFVAKFIGSPCMNILNANVHDGCLCLDNAKFQIPDDWSTLIGSRKEVRFGIRPEHVELAHGEGDVRSRVIYAENHGDCICVQLSVGEDTIMATLDVHFPLGEDLYLNIPWRAVHMFDVETGLNLGYPKEFS